MQRSPRLPSVWSVQGAALVMSVCWVTLDPLFPQLVKAAGQSASAPSEFDYHQMFSELGITRPLLLIGLLAVVFVSMIRTLDIMLRRSANDTSLRSVKAWLLLTTIVAFWCSLWINADAIAWQGKRIRITTQIDALERIASPLRRSFPTEDGELPNLGPFMAYPFGRPSTLILLQSPTLNRRSIVIGAVQRTASGAILLQLHGADGGGWVEWHPPASYPDSFVGGLGDCYQLESSFTIGRGWHLVRYKTT